MFVTCIFMKYLVDEKGWSIEKVLLTMIAESSFYVIFTVAIAIMFATKG